MQNYYTTIRQVKRVEGNMAILIDGASVPSKGIAQVGMYHILYSDGVQTFIREEDVKIFDQE